MMLHDIRYSLRTMMARPGFTLAAATALALGIGANTAIFSVINTVLLRPLPYRDPGDLAMVWLDNRRLGLKEDLMSYPIIEDWRKNQVFSAMSPFTRADFAITGVDEPERVAGAAVTIDFFDILGVRPRLGRVFTVDEDAPGRDSVVILSHGLWTRRYGADPNLAGKTIQLNDRSHTVAGVMPPEFRFPDKTTEVWKPLALPPQAKTARGAFWARVIARRNPGVPWERVRTDMDGIGKRLEKEYPQMAGYGVNPVPLTEQLTGGVKPGLLIMLGAVVFVLLIACANVANLLLARAATRQREIAVRLALGAGRARLIRQLLTESAALALLAGVIGLVLAHWGVIGIAALGPKDVPGLDEIRTDGRVLAFTFGISVLAAFLFGLVPALSASRRDLADSLKEGGRAQSSGLAGRRMRQTLVAVEIALAVVLLAGAGLLIRSFLRVRAVDPGFRTENVLTMRVSLPRSAVQDGPAVVTAFQQLLERIGSAPGVSAAGATTTVFLSITPNSGNFTIEGKPPVPESQQVEATTDAASPDFFRALNVPLLRGRFFTAADGPEAPRVSIVNDTMARTYWPGEDAIGKRFTFGGGGPNARWMTVVGVVADMHRQGLEKRARMETFQPHAQRPSRGMQLVVAASGDAASIAPAVQRLIREWNRGALIWNVASIGQLLGESVAQRRFYMLLLGLFSTLALVLAAIGVYGVMYYAVLERTQEIGIRMALGARRGDVLSMVLRQGLGVTFAGLAVGLAAAFALTRLMTGLLYEVSAGDPATFAAVPLVLIAAAVAASLVPARRAAQVDPMVALRYE
ncbi:MAG: ABC transporter permease [Bryobacteraceae bacterium]